MTLKHTLAAAAAAAVVTVSAHAGTPQTWSFDETTTGQDVSYVSPTPVNPGAELYVSELNITLVEVTVPIFGFPTAIDVTPQLPPEFLNSVGEVLGPAPLTIIADNIVVPPPPDPVAVSADLSTGLDAGGFGVLTATNVVLGTFDAGFPIGVVPIQALRIVGSITITPTVLADVTRDGSVDVNDLVALITAWGLCPPKPEPCPADIDGNGMVDVDDLVAVIVGWTG